MRYWSIGAIFVYVVVASCAIAWFDVPKYTVPSTTSSANPLIAIVLIFLSIVFLLRTAVAPPSLHSRAAGPKFDKSSKKFFFFRASEYWVPHFSRFCEKWGFWLDAHDKPEVNSNVHPSHI